MITVMFCFQACHLLGLKPYIPSCECCEFCLCERVVCRLCRCPWWWSSYGSGPVCWQHLEVARYSISIYICFQSNYNSSFTTSIGREIPPLLLFLMLRILSEVCQWNESHVHEYRFLYVTFSLIALPAILPM